MKIGWEVMTLGDAATFIMGQAPAGKDCNKDGKGVPFVKAGEFGKSRPIIREWTTDPKKFAKSTDVLICVVGATCGKINLGTDCAIGRSAAAIRPIEKQLDQFFLHYFLEGTVRELRAGSLGAAQTVISKDMLSELQILLPPLEEQKRIVSILDEAFEGLDRARENAEANLKSARELFDRYLDVAFQSQLDFKKVPLEDLVEVVSGYSFASGDFGDENPIKSIKITNVGVKKFVQTKTGNLPATFAIDYKRFCIPTGSLVIALTRSIIAGGLKVALVPNEFSGALLNQRVAALKVPNDPSLRDFLYLYMSSSAVLDYVHKSANTLMQPNLSINDLKRLPVPIPKEQKIGKFVDVAMRVSKQTSKMQANYSTRLQDISDLRQSLLQKAFAGELT